MSTPMSTREVTEDHRPLADSELDAGAAASFRA